MVTIDDTVSGILDPIAQRGAAQERYMELFMVQYQRLVNGQPAMCFVTKREQPSVMPPTAVVIDVGMKLHHDAMRVLY